MLHKIGNKQGQMGDIFMFIFFFILVMIFIFGFLSARAFFVAEDKATDIINKALDKASSTGLFTFDNYADMATKLGKIQCDKISITLQTQRDYISEASRNQIYNRITALYPDTQKKVTEYEKTIRAITSNSYSSISDICGRTLKEGDVMTIRASSTQPTLFSKIINLRFLPWRVGSSNTKEIMVSATARRAILNDGSYSGTELLNNLEGILNETKELDPSNYDNTKFYVYTFIYNNAGILQTIHDEPYFDPVNSKNEIDSVADINDKITVLGTDVDGNPIYQGIIWRRPGQNGWINPDGRFTKTYENDGVKLIMTVREVSD